MSESYVQSPFVIDKTKKLYHVVVIVKRLAYAHHDNIRYALLGIRRCGDYLTEHLGGEKIPYLSVDGGSAKTASHSASYLRGNAERISVFVFHKYGLAEKQAKGISTELKAIQDKYNHEFFSQEAYDNEMTTRFGKDFSGKTKGIIDFINKEANEVDRNVLEQLPNNVLGVVYGLIDKVQTRYAVKDTDTAKGGTGKVNNQPDWLKYNEAMNELRTRPHTTADMNALKNKYNIPYTK